MNSLLEILDDTMMELAEETNEVSVSDVVTALNNVASSLSGDTINIYPTCTKGECNGKVVKES